jgi:hypothetical protein
LIGILLALPACKGGGLPEPGPGGGGASGAPAWGMAGGGPMRQGLSAFSGPDTPEIAWKYVAEDDLNGKPAIAPDGSVYVSARRVLLAFSPSGELRWRHSGQRAIADGPFIAANGSILVAYLDAVIENLSPDGSVLWNSAIPQARALVEAIFDGDGNCYALVYTEQDERPIVALDSTGEIDWESEERKVYAGLSANEGRVYFSAENSDLVVYDTVGNFQWRGPNIDLRRISSALRRTAGRTC